MNFARPYQEMQRKIAAGLRAARSLRQRFQLSHSARVVDPTSMSDRAIDLLALREAERYTNRVVNQYNESIGA